MVFKKTVLSKTLLRVLLILFANFTSAQNQPKADSLINILKVAPDSMRLEVIRGIAVNIPSPDSIIYYSELLVLEAKKKNAPFYEHQGILFIGTALIHKGELEAAQRKFLESSEIAKINDLALQEAESYAQLAQLYSANEDRSNFFEFNSKAISVFRKLSDSINLASTLLNSGFNYFEVNSYDSAKNYLVESKIIFQKIDYPLGVAYAIGNLALISFGEGNSKQAEKDLLTAVKLLEPLEDTYAISDYQNQLGKLYLQTGETEKAIESATIGFQLSRQLDLKEQVRDASELLYQLYSEKNNADSALKYHLSFIANRDSIQNTESVKRLANQQADYEVGLKQAEVDVLEAQRETQRALLIGLAIFISVLLVLAFIIYRFYQSKNRLSKELGLQKIELEKLNSTKDKFFSIISHDLRGPVSAFLGISRMIKVLVQTKQTDELLTMTEEIDQSVDRLSSLLDNLLNWAMQQQGNFPNDPEKVNPKELIEELEGVFSTMASAKSIEINNHLANDITLWVDRNSTATIFRNLINNALKFTPEGGKIDISSIVSGNMCDISIKDTGVGIPQDKLDQLFTLQEGKSSYGTKGEKGLGLGLQLVNDFIKMNGGAIDVSSENGEGTIFKVTLPLNPKAT